MYAVIMAGGQGTRLWPLSRKQNPKQLHPIASEVPMIRETFSRLSPRFSSDEIIISTTPDYAKAIKKVLPEIPNKNYILEPSLMGNAAACGLVSKILNLRDPDGTALFLPADAYVKSPDKFLEIIDYIADLTEKYPDHILTIGIKPNKPDVNLGYIEMAKKAGGNESLEVYTVKRFVEKPDYKTAEKYLKNGNYLWNSGIFGWKTNNFLELVEKNLPSIHIALNKIAEVWGTKDENKILKKEYATVENTSIDYGIMEKTSKLLVIPADFGWSDVGSWESLHQVLSGLYDTDIISEGHHIGVDSTNCLIKAGDKLIATIGLKDIVVVDTPDAILICNKKESHRVKELLQKLDDKFL